MDDLSQLTPRRPYLLRAYYDWLLDNELTPHLVVDITLPGVDVPLEFARDGQIILNIFPNAVGNLELGNDFVSFNARFGGISRQVFAPLHSILAIYARENGVGMMFEHELAYEDESGDRDDFAQQETASMASIHLVKGEDESNVVDITEKPTPDDDDPSPPPRGRPALRVVK